MLAGVVAVWGVGLLFVGLTAGRRGGSAHSENMKISKVGILAAMRGELSITTEAEANDETSEPRSNQGIAIRIRTREIVPQGRLSEEATDEVLGAKV